MLVIIILLVLGFLNVVVAAVRMERNNENGALLSFVMATILILAGSVRLYEHGVGRLGLNEKSLKSNAVYETLSSVRDDGKYIVVLRNDGKRIAYLLEKDPPSLFKYTGNPSDPYQVILPIPITHITSISNKKLK